jgi:hypothetical protein
MLGRNVDFFAVFFIALAMLGFAKAQTWDLTEALDSIRVENAIYVERSPISKEVLSNLPCIFNH